MSNTDNNDDHVRFTRLLLESEPVMLRSILVVVPNRADAREIMQETAVALWRLFGSFDPGRPFVNWVMGFSRIETRRLLARQKRPAQLSEQAMEVLERHLATCMQKLTEKQRGLIQGYYHEDLLVLEASGNSFEIVRCLKRAGRTAQVLESSQIGKLKEAHANNDKINAVRIGKAYRAGTGKDLLGPRSADPGTSRLVPCLPQDRQAHQAGHQPHSLLPQ